MNSGDDGQRRTKSPEIGFTPVQRKRLSSCLYSDNTTHRPKSLLPPSNITPVVDVNPWFNKTLRSESSLTYTFNE